MNALIRNTINEAMGMKLNSDVIIGMEVHVQLDTKTKLFCGCATQGSDEPNTRTCVTCLGMPGSKPRLNKKAVEYALKLALATNSKISKKLVFSRKSYFYPDMAKNFQISQYEIPLATKGKIRLKNGKEIGLTRIHMEEDPAALVHIGSMQKSPYVLVDYNRSGNPLLEVVTEPELESAEEAREFMNQLITVLGYLGIFDEKKCIIKADANVSVKESGYVRSEIKNITGFKEIERALKYEIGRQRKELSEGKKLKQETRAWDSDNGVTFSLRTKETEEDYGYILEPDLTLVEITEEFVSKIKKEMPELAHEKIARFTEKHKLRKEDAEIIAAEKEIAELFEKVAGHVNPELAAKWIRRELSRVLNYSKKTLGDVGDIETHLIDLLKSVEKKVITDATAQKLMEKLVEKPFDVLKHIGEEGLAALSDKKEIEKYCKEAIAENPKAAEDYKKGEEKALHFIIGQVMKKTKGKATPKEVNEILKRLIKLL